MTLGQNIQTARRAKGLSQEALAERIGVSRQALGKWEKDTALPGLDNLQAPRRACRDAGCTAGPAGRPRRRGKAPPQAVGLRRGRGGRYPGRAAGGGGLAV